MSEYDWTEIENDPLVLNFIDCRCIRDIHEALMRAFGFPRYYGHNWDALWDMLREFYLWGEDERSVHIYGWNTVDEETKQYCEPMWKIFSEVKSACPNVDFILNS